MKIVIDIPESIYDIIMEDEMISREQLAVLEKHIYYGTPLPKGHGRLIDADAIPEQTELKGFLSQDNAHLVTIDRVKAALNDAPTIIEADNAESEDKG